MIDIYGESVAECCECGHKDKVSDLLKRGGMCALCSANYQREVDNFTYAEYGELLDDD